MSKLAIFALLLLALGGAGWLSLGKIERGMVYPFSPERVDPAKLGLTGIREEEVTVAGHTLIVWVADPAPGQPTIFYFHGNAANLANRAARFEAFVARGYGLIAPAYRGSSGSTGKPSETALTRDARRLWADLDNLIPGLTPADVVLYGESLGSGVALKLLAADGILQPKGVVLEAPYTSLPDVVRHIYPQLVPLIPRMKNIWLSRENVASLTAPLMVWHGAEDTLIPIAQGRAVFDAAPSEQKLFHEIENAGHNEVWRAETAPLLWQFIDGLAPG